MKNIKIHHKLVKSFKIHFQIHEKRQNSPQIHQFQQVGVKFWTKWLPPCSAGACAIKTFMASIFVMSWLVMSLCYVVCHCQSLPPCLVFAGKAGAY
jgi:hypothetical protein